MKDKIVNIAFFFFIITFFYSSYKLVEWFIDNNKNDKVITSINKDVEIKEIPIITTTTKPSDKENTTTKTENIYYDYTKLSLIDVDLTELVKRNKDTKGWIQVKGTNINYPYVQGKDNEYYLTRSFDKKYTDAGWVFMDYRNNPIDFDKNTIIYAHARKNNTMFGELDKLLKNDWYKNKDNHFINISTLKYNSVWQVFSVYHIPTTTDYMQIKFSSDEEFLTFANKLKSRSNKTYKTSIKKEDKILTLSTCYNDTDKLVVHAKLISIQAK